MQNQNQSGTAVKTPRAEMWWVILAKSKTLRFFAVSCEFILFLGGLWITLTVNDPSAKTLLGGNIDMVFLTVMGWAIDAAMPEAWLHVVIQHVDKRTGQLGWSKFVAICISLLFIGNIIYSIMTTGNTTDKVGTPTDTTGWILVCLVILRITIGFVYITVRQCQEWIDRSKGQPAIQASAPTTPQVNIQEEVTKAMESITAKFDQRLAAMQNAQPALNMDVLTDAVSSRLREQMEAFLNSHVTVSPVQETPQIEAPDGVLNSVSKQAETRVLKHEKEPSNTTFETPGRSVSKQQARAKKNSSVEIVRRSRRLSDEEVDAVVHPILNKDNTLSHRKIAPVVNLPETTVYNSVKRYRSTHFTIVSGSVETPEDDDAAI